jgi:hypothetical protein
LAVGDPNQGRGDSAVHGNPNRVRVQWFRNREEARFLPALELDKSSLGTNKCEHIQALLAVHRQSGRIPERPQVVLPPELG